MNCSDALHLLALDALETCEPAERLLRYEAIEVLAGAMSSLVPPPQQTELLSLEKEAKALTVQLHALDRQQSNFLASLRLDADPAASRPGDATPGELSADRAPNDGQSAAGHAPDNGPGAPASRAPFSTEGGGPAQ